MAGHAVCSITALLLLSIPALAAPPRLVLPSSILDISNLTLPSKLSTWPPSPPPDPYIYLDPDFPIAVKFFNHRFIKNRKEQQVRDVLRQATTAAITRSDWNEPIDPELSLVYRSADTDLEISAEEEGQEHEGAVLTWKLWHVVIVALRGFTGAYPGLDFMFQIFVREMVEEKEGRILVGEGLLFAIV